MQLLCRKSRQICADRNTSAVNITIEWFPYNNILGGNASIIRIESETENSVGPSIFLSILFAHTKSITRDASSPQNLFSTWYEERDKKSSSTHILATIEYMY